MRGINLLMQFPFPRGDISSCCTITTFLSQSLVSSQLRHLKAEMGGRSFGGLTWKTEEGKNGISDESVGRGNGVRPGVSTVDRSRLRD